MNRTERIAQRGASADTTRGGAPRVFPEQMPTGRTFAKPMKASVPCPCGQWEWRDVSAMAAIGPMVEPEFCPRCRKRYLVVHRIDVHAGAVRFRTLGVVHLVDEDESCYRTALAKVGGLLEDEIDFLVAVARLRSLPTPQTDAA